MSTNETEHMSRNASEPDMSGKTAFDVADNVVIQDDLVTSNARRTYTREELVALSKADYVNIKPKCLENRLIPLKGSNQNHRERVKDESHGSGNRRSNYNASGNNNNNMGNSTNNNSNAYGNGREDGPKYMSSNNNNSSSSSNNNNGNGNNNNSNNNSDNYNGRGRADGLRDDKQMQRGQRRVGAGRLVRDRYEWNEPRGQEDLQHQHQQQQQRQLGRTREDRRDRFSRPPQGGDSFVRPGFERHHMGHHGAGGGGGFHDHRGEEEPEWFTDPISQNDTIELKGFDGDDRSADNGVSTTTQTAGREATLSIKIAADSSDNSESGDSEHHVLGTRRQQKDDFDINEIFKLDWRNNCMQDAQTTIGTNVQFAQESQQQQQQMNGTSRFAQWFGAADDRCDGSRSRQSPIDRLLSNAVHCSRKMSAGSTLPRPNYFGAATANTSGDSSGAESDNRDLINILQRARISVDDIVRTATPPLVMKQQAKSVAELEASLHGLQPEPETVASSGKDKEIFRRLFNQLEGKQPHVNSSSNNNSSNSQMQHGFDFNQDMWMMQQQQQQLKPEMMKRVPQNCARATPSINTFMPTSVIRKMAAEKDKDLLSKVCNQNGLKTSHHEHGTGPRAISKNAGQPQQQQQQRQQAYNGGNHANFPPNLPLNNIDTMRLMEHSRLQQQLLQQQSELKRLQMMNAAGTHVSAGQLFAAGVPKNPPGLPPMQPGAIGPLQINQLIQQQQHLQQQQQQQQRQQLHNALQSRDMHPLALQQLFIKSAQNQTAGGRMPPYNLQQLMDPLILNHMQMKDQQRQSNNVNNNNNSSNNNNNNVDTGLNKWFGKELLSKQMELPVLPTQKALLLEDIEHQ